MPSSVAHAAVAVLFAPLVAPADRSRGVIALAAALAAAPDLDAIGRPFRRDDLMWLGGHRAITHSLFVAAILAGVVAALWNRRALQTNRRRLFVFFAIVIASHGLLDTLTSYGDGVELFAPLTAMRITARWHPIAGLAAELVALWLPALLAIRFNFGGVWQRAANRPTVE